MSNPFAGLIQSRKAMVALFDITISVALYFVGKYLTPELAADINFLIAAIQAVFVVLIGSIAYEDGAAKRAGNHASQLESRSMDD
jgi:hypothetical protein